MRKWSNDANISETYKKVYTLREGIFFTKQHTSILNFSDHLTDRMNTQHQRKGSKDYFWDFKIFATDALVNTYCPLILYQNY